ncbi:apolipoprotein N-acyltransferase [Halotalea alkalilenta]|uniref:Apolipoprotein N-acyltransferase n=1 Tax=Halotalea alkalilenta TaxID=376489 RepID=A0A172YH74_9GAMM|nr:apolipoprotein N-acyltransferase [Halotalea alkalilenta]ANF58466.1 apolipoprotein N-acyltransferase [Halotalea alkalilenta]
MSSILHRGWLAALAALALGALTTLTFAPFELWWLGPLICAPLYGLLQGTRLRRGMLIGWSYGVGLFGAGASWVYVSIHDYGYTSMPLAAVLTLLFALGLALFYLISAAFYRLLSPRPSVIEPLIFAAAWTLGEVFRGWFLTGFPWLYLGSAHVESLLAGFAPIGGVYLISFLVALSGALLWHLAVRRRVFALVPLAAIWLAGSVLPTQWLSPDPRPIPVALVQGDLPQLTKWSPEGQRTAVNTYLRLTREQAGEAELVIWPETALPMFEEQAMPFYQLAQANMRPGSSLITGVLTRSNGLFHNSMIALDQHMEGGMTRSEYQKHRLVPFGEYVPLEGLLRGLLAFFDMPTSHMSPGPAGQQPLRADGLRLGAAICYEIVYPDLVRDQARHSNILVTISNDTWFGRSIGPLQHMQMAQMRALENNRYLLRATSNGLTAVVGPDGRILAQIARFEPGVLNFEAHAVEGLTPFTRTGSLPIVLVSIALVAVGALLSRRRGASR